MLDSSAFATSKTVGKKNIAKDKMCNYCNKPCHTTEMCQRLNGKSQPENKGFNFGEDKRNQVAQSTQVYQIATVENSLENFLNEEDVERLKKLLLQLEFPTTGSCSMAQMDNIFALNPLDKLFFKPYNQFFYTIFNLFCLFQKPKHSDCRWIIFPYG